MEKCKHKMIKFLKKHNNWSLYTIVLLGISLIPLIWIGKYNVMSADDYSMGKGCHGIWLQTKSIASMLEYAVTHAFKVYRTWQGCFTINFWDSLNPVFWGEGLSWITPILMLTSVLISLGFFVNIVISRFFASDKKENCIVFCVLSFLIIQTMPSPVEGLYWYSGAIAYTFWHYLMLVMFCIIIYVEKVKNNYVRALLGIFAIMYGFFLGGTHYITVLEGLLWYVVFCMLNHKNLKWWNIAPGVTWLCGFLVNVFGPGNSVRQKEADGLNPIPAILQSFIDALRYGKEWLTPMLIVAIFFLVPFAWKIVKKQKRNYMYKYPLIVVGGSYCLFSAAFAPALYGVGNVSSGRIQNVIQGIFYILLWVNLFYVVGWLQRKISETKEGAFDDLRIVKDILKKYSWVYNWVMFAGILVILLGTGDKNTFSSVSALRSLVLGEAQTYYAEAQERLEIYEDESIPIAELKPFSVKPHVLFFTDIVPEGDGNYWINEHVAEYYGKEKVVLLESR